MHFIKPVKNPSERQVVVGQSFQLHRRLEWLDKRIARTQKFLAANLDKPLYVNVLNLRLKESKTARTKLVSEIKRIRLRIEALIA